MKSSYDGIIGLALADAMGVPVEFKTREYLKINPVKDIIGKGTYFQPAGYWSDDTSLTIATMDAIIANSGIINEKTYTKIADNFVSYYMYSSFTPANHIFDIGHTTQNAILKYRNEHCLPYEAGGNTIHNTGNGALMRILPIAYYAFQNNLSTDLTYDIVRKTSSITHRLDTCSLGSFIYVEIAKKLLEGETKKDAYSYIQTLDYSRYFPEKIIDDYSRVLKHNITEFEEASISSRGKTLPSLEASLWSFMSTDNYQDSILKAINLGEDTDTIGAITGGLAGIYYGSNNIPKKWLSKLAKIEYLENLCKAYDESIANKSIPFSYSLSLKYYGKPLDPNKKNFFDEEFPRI